MNNGTGGLVQGNPGFESLSVLDFVLGDVDGDGDVDVFLNNQMYVNDGAGSFTREMSFVARTLSCADVDGDGDLDLYGVDIQTCGLLMNDGSGHFTLDAQAFGGLRPSCERSAWADYDGDGDVDLFAGECGGMMVLADLRS